MLKMENFGIIRKKKVYSNKKSTFKYFFNFVLKGFLIFFLFLIFIDIINKINFENSKIDLKKKLCKKEYILNNCDSPIPLIEKYCIQKEKCYKKKNNKKKVFKILFIIIKDIIINIIYESKLITIIIGILTIYFLQKNK